MFEWKEHGNERYYIHQNGSAGGGSLYEESPGDDGKGRRFYCLEVRKPHAKGRRKVSWMLHDSGRLRELEDGELEFTLKAGDYQAPGIERVVGQHNSLEAFMQKAIDEQVMT